MPPIYQCQRRFRTECASCTREVEGKYDPNVDDEEQTYLKGLGVRKSAELYAIKSIVTHSHRKICNHCYHLPTEQLAKNIIHFCKIYNIKNDHSNELNDLLCNSYLHKFAFIGYKHSEFASDSETIDNSVITFDSISSDRVRVLTAWSKHDLSKMADTIHSDYEEMAQNDENIEIPLLRWILNCLFYFFLECVLSISFHKLAALAKMSIPTYKDRWNHGMKFISDTITKKHLGSSAFNLRNIDQFTSFINDISMFEKLRAILDFSYWYCTTSIDMDKAFITWSHHKKTHLLKFLTVMLCDGTWFDVFGMFPASGKADKSIWTEICTGNSQWAVAIRQSLLAAFSPSMHALK